MTDGRRRLGDDLESIEMRALLQTIYEHYGYDFRDYARGSLRRRLWKRAYAEGLKTLSGLQEKVLHDSSVMESLLVDLSVNVTSMFRDPAFYLSFRRKVVPLLRTYPFIRIWHAGCSTGEEVYSLAILLKEEGLYDRSRIYATDINQQVLERAGGASIPIDRMKDFTQNYLTAGGTRAFSEYYEARGKAAKLDPSILENVVFAQHNLVSDGPFNEFHVVMCRNVMIYFNKGLQDRVHDLLHRSLISLGVLSLGHKETIKYTKAESLYEELDSDEKIYRRIA
ncbi:MAG: chemotaxis protein methyltransferase CheR [Actinomycetota bacterium]|nr:chemotaxis protein methyltransferase CheR [Actinomycetota bacterium]